jgi:hypothetical protein
VGVGEQDPGDPAAGLGGRTYGPSVVLVGGAGVDHERARLRLDHIAVRRFEGHGPGLGGTMR